VTERGNHSIAHITGKGKKKKGKKVLVTGGWRGFGAALFRKSLIFQYGRGDSGGCQRNLETSDGGREGTSREERCEKTRSLL